MNTKLIISAILAVTLIGNAAAQSAANTQASEVAQLRQEVRELRETVERLLAAQPSSRTETSATPAKGPNAEKTPATTEKRLSALESTAARFRFSGDIRVRSESFFQESVPFRHRARIRARLGIDSKLGEDFTGGFAIATGSLDDPISTNNTLTDNFTRKPIGLDRAWVSYQPGQAKWLRLTAGKFAYTWQMTPLTFDSDLNPEGFSEKFSFDVKNNIVKNISVTALQLVANEVAGSNLPVRISGEDTFAAGGQVSARFAFGKRVLSTVSGSALNWVNADSVAKALSTKVLGGNRNTNATVGTAGNTVYASQFLYTDFTADTTVQTWNKKWPARFLIDYVRNPKAASDQNQGLWFESTIGRQAEQNDIQLSYAIARIEQDAVIAAFNESDFRAPTNVLQHRLSLQWLVKKNTTVSVTNWLGHTLNTRLKNAALPPGTAVGSKDPNLNRLQVDLIYRF